jgi:hypothetical protein
MVIEKEKYDTLSSFRKLFNPVFDNNGQNALSQISLSEHYSIGIERTHSFYNCLISSANLP